ncbi:MAG: glycosyltransferase [Gammaproteobacteria bacterium]|nr:glycosyltransferase [Gammaproteobacteria bacterium]
MYSVGLSIIARNEEANIAACLETVADLVSEIVVADTGSTDSTREQAARFGAKVIEFPWCDDFAAARNASLDGISASWVFWMDADDRLDDANRRGLGALFESLPEENIGYVMKYVSPWQDSARKASITDHLRLFRNQPDIRWQGRVHEQIRKPILDAGGEVRNAGLTINHLGYQTAQLRQQKAHRNLTLLLKQLAENPDSSFTLYNIGQCYLVLGQKTEAFPYFRRSHELAPPDAPFLHSLYVHLVDSLYDNQLFQEALDLCRQGRMIFKDDVELLFHEASLAIETGDLLVGELMLKHWLTLPVGEEVLARDSYIPCKARQNLACIYLSQGKLTEGERELNEIVHTQPNYLPVWQVLRQLYLKQGRVQEAEDALRRLNMGSGNGATTSK